MKALIQKEIRENLKLALPVFLLLAGSFMFASWEGGNIFVGNENPKTISVVFAGFAAVLGWLQLHHERPRDRWAFLVHRPITRTEIFVAKVGAGLSLYFLAVGVPMAGYLLWIRIPGHAGEPFEWAMALPGLGCVLLGTIWYFAAMLTSVREARWYGSRGMGLAAAVPLHAVALGLPGLFLFWQFELVIVLLAAVLAVAVWGGFQTDGQYREQPAAGKAALAIVVSCGATLVVVLVIIFLAAVLHEPELNTFYSVTKSGELFQVTTRGERPALITDLSGVPLKDPKTGRNMELEEFNKRTANEQQVPVDLADPPQAVPNLKQPREFFYLPWRMVDGVVWHWTRHGQLVGYEAVTRRFVGSLGPGGSASNGPGPEGRFLRPTHAAYGITPRTLATSSTVYEMDLPDRAAKPIFTVPVGDRIGGTRDLSDNATIIVSKQFIQLVDAGGKTLWRFPHDPEYGEPRYISVVPLELEATGQYVLWIFSPRLQSERLEGKVRRQMVRISGDKVVSRMELKSPNPPQAGGERLDEVLSAFVPPEFPFLKPLVFRFALSRVPIQWNLVAFAMISAGLCAVAGWLIGRSYRLPMRAQLAWALFHLLAGFPGFLAFLSVRDWPARESCPNCKRLRTVDREHCEHCGAKFAPPQRKGSEIFEVVGLPSGGKEGTEKELNRSS